MILVGIAVACGCGGGVESPRMVAVTATVTNEYAESLFSLDATVEGTNGEPAHLLIDKDIAAYRSATSGPVNIPAGGRVRWSLSSMSLGERYTFPDVTETVPANRVSAVYVFTYDYNLATANFRISHGWK